jgi:hypothetical protein
MQNRGSTVRIQKPSQDYWTNVALGRTWAWLSIMNGARDRWSGVELNVGGPNAAAQFDAIRQEHGAHLEGIAQRFGAQVEWLDEPRRKQKICRFRRSSNFADHSTWWELNEWLAGMTEQLHSFLSPIVKAPSQPGVL